MYSIMYTSIVIPCNFIPITTHRSRVPNNVERCVRRNGGYLTSYVDEGVRLVHNFIPQYFFDDVLQRDDADHFVERIPLSIAPPQKKKKKTVRSAVTFAHFFLFIASTIINKMLTACQGASPVMPAADKTTPKANGTRDSLSFTPAKTQTGNWVYQSKGIAAKARQTRRSELLQNTRNRYIELPPGARTVSAGASRRCSQFPP